jgi:hypothetical protein
MSRRATASSFARRAIEHSDAPVKGTQLLRQHAKGRANRLGQAGGGIMI